MHNDLGKQISLSDTFDQFISAMREQGIETDDEIVADGKLHRIHVVGDARGSRNGFYCLHYDEKPAGIFGCNKRYGFDHKFQWQSNVKTAPWTEEERQAYRDRVAKERAEKDAAEKARHEAAASAANDLWNASQEATDDHPYLKSKGVKAHGLRVGRWEKVNKETGEVRFISDNTLLVPICDRTRKIHSLQAIFPSKLKIMGDRNKDYMSDGAKRGLFHTIGTKPLAHDGEPVFVLTEGYATGASLHECTGHLVLVCFDAGNLPVVAKEIFGRMVALGKEAIILLAADNDRWTVEPVENPGVYHAKNAVKAVGSMGRLAVPDFTDLSGEPTDFNDLHQREGAEVVANAIAEALNPPAEAEEDIPWGDEPVHAAEAAGEHPAQPHTGSPAAADDEIEDELSNNGHFTILGYDEDDYFFFHHGKKQILVRTARAFSDTGLIELAPVNWWEESFPAANGGIDKKAACNWLFRTADARGIYDMSRVRGRGAWLDKGRYIFHHGDRLTVDGVTTGITRIQSSYVYPMAQRMPEPAENMLTAEEGRHLLEVAKMVRWSMPASAAMLAGWTMLAPICGALRWRPHIWITGAAGSGKSTMQRDYVAALIRNISVYAQGESTEAGIRQRLKGDARPVLMDEAESNDEKSKARMEAILATIRQASTESEAETLKGTVSGQSMRFCIRSMFCLASINTNLGNKADVDRLTKLVVRPPARDGSSEEHWKKLSEELYKISTDETFASRLLARALKLLPNILKNVEVFSRVAAKFFGSQRDGDQFGTMLAGAWSLCSDDVATDAQAEKMIGRYEWKEHIEDHDQDDAERALGHVLDAKIRVGSVGELSVYELIRECSTPHRLGQLQAKDADAALRRHGIRVEIKDNLLIFGTSVKSLKELVAKSSYATDLRGQLLRLDGADRYDNKPLKFNGHNSKVVTIPLSPILEGEPVNPDEPPI
ncbi:DNA primase [Aeromonas phage ST4]|nr:DNA primase [Aeromonas phage ST4]